MREQSFINGFVKRAQEYGYSTVQAEQLLKQAGILESIKNFYNVGPVAQLGAGLGSMSAGGSYLDGMNDVVANTPASLAGGGLSKARSFSPGTVLGGLASMAGGGTFGEGMTDTANNFAKPIPFNR